MATAIPTLPRDLIKLPAVSEGSRPAGSLTRPAVIDVRLAVAPRVARLAVAAVAAIGVLAGGAVAARALHALVDVHLAGLPWGEEEGAVASALLPLSLVHPAMGYSRPQGVLGDAQEERKGKVNSCFRGPPTLAGGSESPGSSPKMGSSLSAILEPPTPWGPPSLSQSLLELCGAGRPHPASPRGRRRRSSHSPQRPCTRHCFCRDWGRTGPAPPHTWLLTGEGQMLRPREP